MNIGKSHTAKSNYRLKLEVLKYYSKNRLICSCCGESEEYFLCIDHIKGGGKEHRKQFGGRSGSHLYRWLKKNDYPIDFQVLCYNCNMAKSFLGECPHKNKHIERR